MRRRWAPQVFARYQRGGRPDGKGSSPTPSLEDIEDALVDGDRPISGGTARAALRHRTFRIVFVGAFASNIGTWMQNVVLGAYAYSLTHSSIFVGVLIFAQLGPALFLSMVGGLVADRVNRKRLLIVVSIEQLVFSALLAWVATNPSPSHALLVLMVVMVGVGNALFAPAYSAILPGMVGKQDLPGAISLNSAQMNGSRVIGPIIGGVAYHFAGPAWVFGANALTYLFVVASLMIVTLPDVANRTQYPSRWRELTAGITVAREDRVVGRCLVTIALFSFMALAFIGQMPVVAARNLGVSPNSATYGVLYACFGMGALLGAISVGTWLARRSKPLIVRVCLVCYSVSLATFSLLREALPAFFIVMLVGFFYFAFVTSLNTVLQTNLDDAVRGRVMALWIMGFGGTIALGNLLLGPVVAEIGITDVLLFGAGVALVLAWYADVRPDATSIEVGRGPLEVA
jgi:MFS family permease